MNEVMIEDIKLEWGTAHIHFPDRDEDAGNFILDIGTDHNQMGIQCWVTIEGGLDENPGEWNLFQVSCMLRHTYDTVVSLADLDNIDRSLEDFPDLLALAQRTIDAIKEKHPELR